MHSARTMLGTNPTLLGTTPTMLGTMGQTSATLRLLMTGGSSWHSSSLRCLSRQLLVDAEEGMPWDVNADGRWKGDRD